MQPTMSSGVAFRASQRDPVGLHTNELSHLAKLQLQAALSVSSPQSTGKLGKSDVTSVSCPIQLKNLLK